MRADGPPPKHLEQWHHPWRLAQRFLLSKSLRKATPRIATIGEESHFCLFQARCSAESFSTGWRQSLTPEQAGYRKGRGCMDQIFALWNVIEQCLEWNTPLHDNLWTLGRLSVSSSGCFSVHRNTRWKILHSYGIPIKIIGNNLSEWFPVQSGVRQGRIVSPILFLVTTDWISTNTTVDRPRGIQWTPAGRFRFRRRSCSPINQPQQHADKNWRLNNFARQVRPCINTSKTQVLSKFHPHRTHPCRCRLWKISVIWKASSVRTAGHRKTLKQGWERLRVPSPNSVPSRDQSNTVLKPRYSFIRAMWNLFCCMALRGGEWWERTQWKWRCSTIDALGEYARSFGQTQFQTQNCTIKQGCDDHRDFTSCQ